MELVRQMIMIVVTHSDMVFRDDLHTEGSPQSALQLAVSLTFAPDTTIELSRPLYRDFTFYWLGNE